MALTDAQEQREVSKKALFPRFDWNYLTGDVSWDGQTAR
jgi:hypothetical protein